MADRRVPHWPLARIHIGPSGGGALVGNGCPERNWASLEVHDQFGEGRESLPVQTRDRFVGRRKDAQAALTELRAGKGLLIRGMGAAGKSSLAARLALLSTHLVPVVIRANFDPPYIYRELVAQAPAGRQADLQADWNNGIGAEGWRDPAKFTALRAQFTQVLEALKAGAAPKESSTREVLLVLDDLEGGGGTDRTAGGGALQPLEQGAEHAQVKPALAPGLGALLDAFARKGKQTGSRLIVTSRYAFRLPQQDGNDLAAKLADLPLLPLKDSAQRRFWRAVLRTTAGGLQGLPPAPGPADDAEAVARKQTARGAAILEREALAGDPQAYLADVLDRIHDHKNNRLGELLPWNWTPAGTEQAEAA